MTSLKTKGPSFSKTTGMNRGKERKRSPSEDGVESKPALHGLRHARSTRSPHLPLVKTGGPSARAQDSSSRHMVQVQGESKSILAEIWQLFRDVAMWQSQSLWPW